MEIQLNGKKTEVVDGITVRVLLEHLKLQIPRVAVQVNADIIKRERYDAVLLQPGDNVEVLTFISGG
jgi:sulfur carrier protein